MKACRHFLADDRGRLKQSLVVGWQLVDPRGNDRLNGRGDLPYVRRMRDPVGPRIPDEQEERLDLTFPEEQPLDRILDTLRRWIDFPPPS